MHSTNIWRAVSRKSRAGSLVALALTLGAGAAAWGQDASSQAARVALPYNQGAVAKLLQNARFLGHQSPQTKVLMDFELPLRNQSQLDTLNEELYDKNDPHYHHYLTPQQFAAQFGPTQADYDAVKSYVESQGFSVVSTTPSRTLLTFSGSTDAVEKAFGLRLNRYLMPNGHVNYAATGLPSVPKAIADRVIGVVGLSDLAVRHHHHTVVNALDRALMDIHHAFGNGPAGGLSPAEVQTAYDVPTTVAGQGVSVALYELDGYHPSDIDTFATNYSIPTPNLQNVYIDGYDGTIQDPTFGGEVEVVLDLDMVLTMAPKIGTLYYYGAENGTVGMTDEYQKIANDDLASVVSTSWGLPEDLTDTTDVQTEAGIFAQMRSQGQTLYDASGDDGAFDDPDTPTTPEVDDPAGQPNVTGVGGTELKLTATGGYGGETAWSGSGGGASTIWATPTYQKAIAGSNTFREVPDVAMNADPDSGYDIFVSDIEDDNDGSGWLTVGGTSAAAPLWAGLTALINQELSVSGGTNIGFINPALYAIGASATEYPADFNDILTGSNGKFSAAKGYDQVTGWGSFNATGLFNQLAIPAGSVVGSITGTVTDTNGNPITVTPSGTTTPVGAVTVTAVVTSTGQVAASTTTSLTGTYTLSLESAFTYTLTFTAAGYAGTTISDVTIPSSGTLTENVELPTSPHTYPGGGWQMISAPEDFTNVADFSQIFGLADDPPTGADPTLFIWEPGQNNYVQTPSSPADTMHIGDGYWIDLASSASISRQGISVPNTQKDFLIVLNQGWNMIGDPFPQPIQLTTLEIAPVSSPTNTTSFGQSAAVNQTLYTFPAGALGYEQVTATGTPNTLQPYAGYWIEANEGCELVIPNPNYTP